MKPADGAFALLVACSSCASLWAPSLATSALLACSGSKSSDILDSTADAAAPSATATATTPVGTGTAPGGPTTGGPTGTTAPPPPPAPLCVAGKPCDKRDCSDSACRCATGTQCDLTCASPPCQVECENDSRCSGTCSNGVCRCDQQATCGFTCGAPPCNVTCDGANPSCGGTCADGECRCGQGSSCAFTCASPPCLVNCEGNNPSCKGTCANNTCRCGTNSVCSFECADGPCHIACDKGAKCSVTCRPETVGTENCEISACDGPPAICPDKKTTTCGTPCP